MGTPSRQEPMGSEIVSREGESGPPRRLRTRSVRETFIIIIGGVGKGCQNQVAHSPVAFGRRGSPHHVIRSATRWIGGERQKPGNGRASSGHGGSFCPGRRARAGCRR